MDESKNDAIPFSRQHFDEELLKIPTTSSSYLDLAFGYSQLLLNDHSEYSELKTQFVKLFSWRTRPDDPGNLFNLNRFPPESELSDWKLLMLPFHPRMLSCNVKHERVLRFATEFFRR
jgi:hypothetical protein